MKLDDWDYRVALTILYVPYVCAEIPSNLLIKRIGPKLWLSGLVTTWGVVATLQGIVQSRAGLWANRFFLGLCEGGILPGIILYLSLAYRRTELQLRVGFFWAASSLAGSLGGLLAAAIGLMGGVAGLDGWRWIFILEGIFTVLCGAAGFYFIPDSPVRSRLMTPRETEVAVARLREDAAHRDDGLEDKSKTLDEQEKFSWSEVMKPFKQLHFYLLACLGFQTGVNVYSIAYFLPTIIKSLSVAKSSTWVTQLLTVPPYAAALIASLTACYFSDRFQRRGVFIMFPLIVGLIGYIIFISTLNVGARYFSIFLMVPGIYTAVPGFLAWSSNNFIGHYERATALGSMIVMTNSGGICSTWLFMNNEAPRYVRGTSVNIGLCTFGILIVVALEIIYIRHNRQAPNGGFKYII